MFNILPKELLQALLLLLTGMFTNIFIGTASANYVHKWDKEVFIKGLYKAIVIFLTITVIAFATSIDTSLSINEVPLLEYIYIALVPGYFYYFGQATIKVLKLLRLPTEGEEE